MSQMAARSTRERTVCGCAVGVDEGVCLINSSDDDMLFCKHAAEIARIHKAVAARHSLSFSLEDF